MRPTMTSSWPTCAEALAAATLVPVAAPFVTKPAGRLGAAAAGVAVRGLASPQAASARMAVTEAMAVVAVVRFRAFSLG
jgi:hypothetical protein